MHKLRLAKFRSPGPLIHKWLVLQHLDFFAACDDFVGRAPRPAADPLVGLLGRSKNSGLVAALLLRGQPFSAAAGF